MQVFNNTFALIKYLWGGGGVGRRNFEDTYYYIFILGSSNLKMMQNKMPAYEYIRYLRKKMYVLNCYFTYLRHFPDLWYKITAM